MKKYEFLGSCTNHKFCIMGINLFKYKWNMVGDVVVVIDPKSQMPRNFSAYKIKAGEREICFVAGKLADDSWGFFKYE